MQPQSEVVYPRNSSFQIGFFFFSVAIGNHKSEKPPFEAA